MRLRPPALHRLQRRVPSLVRASGLRLAAAADLVAPARAVPVAAKVGRVDRHHDFVALAGPDLVVATRAAVRLHRLVRLHVTDLDRVVEAPAAHEPNAAHTTSNATTASAMTTSAISLRRLTAGRNGLNPTTAR